MKTEAIASIQKQIEDLDKVERIALNGAAHDDQMPILHMIANSKAVCRETITSLEELGPDVDPAAILRHHAERIRVASVVIG